MDVYDVILSLTFVVENGDGRVVNGNELGLAQGKHQIVGVALVIPDQRRAIKVVDEPTRRDKCNT